MKTRFFIFPDEETASYLAYTSGLTAPDEHGQHFLVRFTDEYALDVIGVVCEPTGKMLVGEEGEEYAEEKPLQGWFVNARILSGDPIPEAFKPFEVFPKTPDRDFL